MQNEVSGKIICEFWSGSGHRRFLMCKKKREMLLDETGSEILPEVAISMSKEDLKCAQLVVEMEVSPSDRKKYPELSQSIYYTRRDCVDDCKWPIGSPIPITVPARICSWEAASSEPLDPREEHRKLPITTSAGFAAGVREHDLLLQGGAMIESMQHFFEDVNNKFANIAKGSLNKNHINIIAIVLGILIVISLIVGVMVMLKLQNAGL